MEGKKERVVCAAIYVMSVKDGYEGTRIVKGVNYEEIHNDGLVFEISHPTWCNMYIHGFATNKNRFVDPVEAMKIAIKSGQYPDYELMKRKALEEIEYAKENEEYNKSVGVLGSNLYVADISGLNERIKELDKLLERKQLRPEDLY